MSIITNINEMDMRHVCTIFCKQKLSIASILVTIFSCARAPEPYGPVPTSQQIEWQKMETNMFCHFGPNTFTSAEWGDGSEDADIFNPTDMDCRQWARIAKAAGMKGIIITAKHHDGFCLWPNPASSHTVAESSWRGGKGDVLKDLSEACREYGLKFGVYVSPWDRNDPDYGSDRYNEKFRQTLASALGNYGQVFEQWFDGACGEGPNGKRQIYDWPLYHEEVYKHQPDAIIFSDIGPGCRWVGNERGSAGRTCWSTLDVEGFSPGHAPDLDTLNQGNVHGTQWIPAETDVSVRPGWFYKQSEDASVKSVEELLMIWYESVGRNSLLLLNVPPDKRGQLCSVDSAAVVGLRAAIDSITSLDLAAGIRTSATESRGWKFRPGNLTDGDYDTYWTVKDDTRQASVTVWLDSLVEFNRICLQEYIPLGQRVSSFSIDARDSSGMWNRIASETTIGYKRIVLVPKTLSDAVRINIESSHACPVLNNFSLYMDRILPDPPKEKVVNPEWTISLSEEHRIIDLGREAFVSGFVYAPVPNGEFGCIITYNLETSEDGKHWKKVISDDMFDNIVNNPVRQTVMFPKPVWCRYLKLVPLRTNSQTYGISEFDAIR